MGRRIEVINGEKACSRCKKVKKTEEFGKSTQQGTGLKAECKICYNAHRKKHYEQIRDKHAGYQKKSHTKYKAKIQVQHKGYMEKRLAENEEIGRFTGVYERHPDKWHKVL